MSVAKNNISRLTPQYFSWQRSGAGFTLIELLIVAAIFSLTALLATTVFSNIQTSQRQISGQQRVTTDGRYVLETIAQSVRTGTINYVRLNPNTLELESPASDNILSTVDALGQVTCYRFNASRVEVLTGATIDCLGQNGSDWTPFTPEDLEVQALKFYITPTSDPYRPVPRVDTDCQISPPETSGVAPNIVVDAGFDSSLGACICRDTNDCFTDQQCTVAGSKSICTNPNIQPQVTIFLQSRSGSTRPGEKAEVTLQTTVVSRVYQR